MQAAVIKRSIVYFPVSQDLADHVKRLDGFNVKWPLIPLKPSQLESVLI